MTDFTQDFMAHAGRTLATRSLSQQVASNGFLDASWQPALKNADGALPAGWFGGKPDLSDPGFGIFSPPAIQEARASMRDARVDDSLFLLRTFSTYADNHADEGGMARKRGEWDTFASSLGGDDVELDVALDDVDNTLEAEARAATAGHVRRALRMSLNHDGKQQAAAPAQPPLLAANPPQSPPPAPGYDATWLPAGGDAQWRRRLARQQDQQQESRVHSSGLASSPDASLAPGSGAKRGPVPAGSEPAFVPWGASSAGAMSGALGKSWQTDGRGDALNPATLCSQRGSPLDLYAGAGVSSTPAQRLENPGALLSQAAQLNWYEPPASHLSQENAATSAKGEGNETSSPQRAGKQSVKNKVAMQAPRAPAQEPATQAPPSPARPAKSLDTSVHKTLMVRNIPMRYTQDMLLVEWPPQGSYDFLYLPICIDKKRNASFAFVNFVTREAAQAFYRRWHKQRLEHYSARKPLDISPADVQGREENLLQIMRNKTFRIRNAHFQPAIFEGNERVSMEAFFEKRGIVSTHSKGSTAQGQLPHADDMAETMLAADTSATRMQTCDPTWTTAAPKAPFKANGYGQLPPNTCLQSSALGGDLSALAAAAGLPLFPLNSRTAEYVPYGMV